MNAQLTSGLKKKRLSTNAWVIILVSAVMSACAIYALFNWFEIVEEEMLVGAKGEALTNPYYALQQFLLASGANATLANKSNELDRGLAQPLLPPQVMLLGDRRLTEMTVARVNRINDWVRDGGHLIIEAEQPSLEDRVLAQFAIERNPLVWHKNKLVEIPRKPSAEATETTEDANANANAKKNEAQQQWTPANGAHREFDNLRPLGSRPTRITLADGTPFITKFQPYQNVLKLPLPAPPTATTIDNRRLVTDRDGGRIIEFQEGLGRVTVISNFDFLTYKNLEDYDHAELIWHLISNANSTKPSILVALNRQSEGFWKWLTTHAWMVAISGLVLLLVWLWRVIPRMGPMALPEPTSRRSLLEHMVAAGAFLAKQKQWQALLNPVRAKFIQRYRYRHPRTLNMSDVDFLQHVARHLQVDENQLARLLFVPVATRQEALMVLRQLISLFTIVK